MPSPILIDVRPVQEENAVDSNEMTLSGMVIDDKPVQLENALIPILVTPLPIFTVVNFEHE